MKGVNDDFKTLAELYTLLRDNDIENHYLFHAVPLRGMSHHRTSVDKGLELITALAAVENFSGRTKPKYCILSDIGKIVLYQDTIIKRDEKTNSILLKSGFNIEDRLKMGSILEKPDTVEIDKDGFMSVWYLDGSDVVQSFVDKEKDFSISPLKN